MSRALAKHSEWNSRLRHSSETGSGIKRRTSRVLKRDFAGYLHDARINSGGGEGTVGRRCRRDSADDRSKLSGIGRVRHWIGEIGVVEDVISIGANREVEPFVQLEVFPQAKISIEITWSAESISPQ